MGQSVGVDLAEQTGFRPVVENGAHAAGDKRDVPPRELARPDKGEESSIEGPSGEPLNIVVRGEAPTSSVRAEASGGSGASATPSLPSSWSGGGSGPSRPLGGAAALAWQAQQSQQAWPQQVQLPPQFQVFGGLSDLSSSQGLGPTTAAEAEAECQRRAAQIAALHCQVEAARSELAQLRRPSAAAAIALAQQARQLITAFQPELGAVKAKLARTAHVASELHSWFVTHRDKMSIEDPSRSPSAQLHHRLQSCEILIDGFRSVAERVEGVLEVALKDAQPTVSGSRPGPTPQGARPGGAGVPGLWVRDPDGMKVLGSPTDARHIEV
ncbi:unnamed protein product [Symbiodinium natans]|uniref:Uncharacterized protein n=1 Tax=Symbiodinium natans TaxID=878477 RepID=A0A812MES4_9DINO|nr:unnamed protein product [Symbiodinium natans]